MKPIHYPNSRVDIVLIGRPGQYLRSFMIQPLKAGEYLLAVWPKGNRDKNRIFYSYFSYRGIENPPFFTKYDLGPFSQITEWEWSLFENGNVSTSEELIADFIITGQEITKGSFNLNIDQPGMPLQQRYIAWSCNQPYLGDKGEPTSIGPYTEGIFQWYRSQLTFLKPDEVWAFGDTAYSDGVPATDFVDNYYDKINMDKNKPAQKNLLIDYRRMYTYTWSWSDFQYTMHNFHHCCIWDDHEIRDGWGSEQNDFRDNNFPIGEIARTAAEEYILNMGPRVRKSLVNAKKQPDAHQSRIEGSAAIFVFDGRSSRNYRDRRSTLISQQQEDDFKDFLHSLKHNYDIKYLLLGCGVPLINLKDFVEILASTAPKELTDLIGGIRDDVRDSWHSPGNKPGLKVIINIIRELVLDRNDIKVVFVSGDIHVANAFSFLPPRFPAPCYQLTTSALTNRQHLSETGSKFLSVGDSGYSDVLGTITRIWDEIQDPNFLDLRLTANSLTASLYVYNTENHDKNLPQDTDPVFTLSI